MDQENKQPSADTNIGSSTTPSTDTHTQASNTATCEPAPTMEQLMQKSPKLSPLCGWIKCLRAPALSMRYSIQKQHIPDLDTQDSGQKATTKQEQSAPAAKGQTSDVMDVTGGFTIRYFDFALGILGLMVAGILVKGGCFLKKKMF